ncbi:MAG: hypothetical protein V4773_27845 [Verrucomicrobiota bacterium]
MNDTAELPLELPEPDISPAQVEQLVTVLRDGWRQPRLGETAKEQARREHGWLTAKEIAAQMGAGIGDRQVREIASAAAPAVVSYPGSPGYKLWQLCSVEEINHAIEAFESQGSDMLKRAVTYRRAYHRRFRGCQTGEAANGGGDLI